MSYYFSKVLKNTSYTEALEQVAIELKKEGFGVLTEIDMKETLKNKIDVDFKKYKILGACNPKFAHKALQLEDKVGMFLPCNIVVEEHENGDVEVSAIDPVTAMISVSNRAIESLATDVRQALVRVINNMG